jgi:hypothetical protein
LLLIKNIKKMNQSGMGLLQVVIFSGLLGVMGVAFVKMTDQQNKSLETSKIYFEVAEFTDKARISLSESDACVATFGNNAYGSEYTVTALHKTHTVPGTSNKVTTILASVNDEIAPNLKLLEIRMKSVDIANKKALAVISIERKAGTGFGTQVVKREIQMMALDPAPATGKITNCFTTGTSVDDPAILCSSLGGTWNIGDKRCDGIVAIDPTPVFCKKYSKRTLAQDATGRLKIVCQDCNPVPKFHHWTCDHYPGKSSYSNLCHYTMVCAGATNDLMRPAQWDGRKGPIDASGGDTSDHGPCVSKRRACSGEPAGMSENEVNP